MMESKIAELGDLELAILVCLVARQHCIFSTNATSTEGLQNELRLICSSIFGLTPAVIQCSASTTVDEFSEAMLVEVTSNDLDDAEQGYFRARPTLSVDFTPTRGRSPGKPSSNTLDDRRIADVIIAANLDQADEAVQIQALELIRTRRIFTRTAMHSASKDFMVLAISSASESRLNHHLNDLFCMSHFHPEEDGLPFQDGQLSKEAMPSLSRDEISELRTLADHARHTPEIAAYMHHICVFMKNSRYIQGGVTATATRQLRVLAKALAPLHGLDYVPPSLVALAVRKIYPHRIVLVTTETERSVQWGSDPSAIKALLEGFTIEDAIEDVLASVGTPL